MANKEKEVGIKIVGIDIGLDGALAIGEGNTKTKEFKITEFKFFPTIEQEENTKRDFIPADICSLIPDDTILAIIERPSLIPFQAIQACALNHKCLGYLEMVLLTKKIAYQIIPSNTWREELTKGLKRTVTETTAVIACKKIFPNLNLRRTEKSSKDNDNMAEAALLAYYGWLTWNKIDEK